METENRTAGEKKVFEELYAINARSCWFYKEAFKKSKRLFLKNLFRKLYLEKKNNLEVLSAFLKNKNYDAKNEPGSICKIREHKNMLLKNCFKHEKQGIIQYTSNFKKIKDPEMLSIIDQQIKCSRKNLREISRMGMDIY